MIYDDVDDDDASWTGAKATTNAKISSLVLVELFRLFLDLS